MEKSSNHKVPDFAIFSDIMERFYQVPYETFQAELKAWMTNGLAATSANLSEANKEDFLQQLFAIGDRVFSAADEAAD